MRARGAVGLEGEARGKRAGQESAEKYIPFPAPGGQPRVFQARDLGTRGRCGSMSRPAAVYQRQGKCTGKLCRSLDPAPIHNAEELLKRQTIAGLPLDLMDC